ncbi:MAG: hypothetical protein Q8P67_08160, partial [archaeon]|nr:hypothetical protein [archaeon]
ALLSVLISELKGTLRSLNTKVQEVEGSLAAQQAVARAQRKELDLVRFRISEQELAISSLQASEQALNRHLQNVPEPYDDAREIQEVLTRTDLLEKEQQIFHHQTDQIMLLLGKVYTSTEPDALARLLESYNLQLILDKCREIYYGSIEKMAIHSDLPRLARNFEIVDIDGNSVLHLDSEDSIGACCLKVLCALARALLPEPAEAVALIQERWAMDENEDKAAYILRFLQQTLGEQSRVVRILRACNQAVLAPFVTRVKLGLGDALAHNSTRNSWKIHIRVHPDCVLVTHTKREQAAPSTESSFGHFEFEWAVEYTLDDGLITFADVSFSLSKYFRLDHVSPPTNLAEQVREIFNDLIIGTLVWSPDLERNLKEIKRAMASGVLRLRRGATKLRPVSAIGAMSPLKSTPTPMSPILLSLGSTESLSESSPTGKLADDAPEHPVVKFSEDSPDLCYDLESPIEASASTDVFSDPFFPHLSVSSSIAALSVHTALASASTDQLSPDASDALDRAASSSVPSADDHHASPCRDRAISLIIPSPLSPLPSPIAPLPAPIAPLPAPLAAPPSLSRPPNLNPPPMLSQSLITRTPVPPPSTVSLEQIRQVLAPDTDAAGHACSHIEAVVKAARTSTEALASALSVVATAVSLLRSLNRFFRSLHEVHPMITSDPMFFSYLQQSEDLCVVAPFSQTTQFEKRLAIHEDCLPSAVKLARLLAHFSAKFEQGPSEPSDS